MVQSFCIIHTFWTQTLNPITAFWEISKLYTEKIGALITGKRTWLSQMLELLATKRWREWARAHECLAPWLFPTDNPAVVFMFLKSHQVIWSHRSLWIQDPGGQSCCCTLAQAPHGWGLPQLRLWDIKVLWHQIQTCRHIPFRSGSVVIYWITSSLINTKCILPVTLCHVHQTATIFIFKLFFIILKEAQSGICERKLYQKFQH